MSNYQQQQMYPTRIQAAHYLKPANPLHQILFHPGPHHTKQIEAAQRARLAGTQAHHHARVAASQQRMNNNVANTDESSTWNALDMGGMQINQLHVGLFRYTFLTSLYLNHNNLTSLSPLIANLNCLSVLNLAGNKLTGLPIELALVVSLKELLLFDNQLTFIPPEYGQLYQLELLGLEGNPMSEPILSMIVEKGTTAVVRYLRDSCPMGPPPTDRDWIEVDDGFNGTAIGISNLIVEAFTVMSYNTLCEKYATPQTYAYTPAWALAWEYRRDLLLQEILNYGADIICLQEVEMRQYEDFFKEQLGQLSDYDGTFFPKSRSRTMGEYERKQVDGCATLFKTSKYKMVEKQHIEFQQIAMQRPDLYRCEDVLNRVMIKDNVAIITLLESKETGSRVLVANCHLHWDPAYSDVKVIQTALLLDEVQKSNRLWAKKYNCIIPNIISGDFNSLPGSGVVEFLSKGVIAPNHPELKDHNYQPFTDRGLSHSISLKSAYNLDDDIEFTNLTPMFKGIIDYIWYDSNLLATTGILGGVDRTYVAKIVGFPNPHHPSDHIPLVVSMRFKK